MKNKVKLTESIQSKFVEPACAEFPSNVVRNSAKNAVGKIAERRQIRKSKHPQIPILAKICSIT